MFGITNDTRVFLRTGVTDGRLGVEALRGLVSTVLHDNARGGHLFAFCNGRANRVKHRMLKAMGKTQPPDVTVHLRFAPAE